MDSPSLLLNKKTMSRIKFRMTAGTNVGCVRTNNEDNFIINDNLSQSDWFLPQDTSQIISLSQDGCVLVVADGMGGLNAGEVASAIAIETVKQSFLDADLQKVAKTSKAIEKFMRDIVIKSDQAIKKHVKAHPETQGMGTTLIFIWVHGTTAHMVWCGDSRAYIYNDEKGLVRFSKDHSYVQQLVDDGKLDEDLAFDHPDSNIITRCLGDFQDRAKPDYKTYELQAGDILLICSDGLCGLCRDEEILHIMQQTSTDIELCKQTLIQSALDAGGYDNVTLALFETVAIGDVEKKASKKKLLQNPLVARNTRETKEINEEAFAEDEPIVVQEDGVVVEVKEQPVREVDTTTQEIEEGGQDEDCVVEEVEDDIEGEDAADSDVGEEDVDVVLDVEGVSKHGRWLRLVLIVLIILTVLVALCYVFHVEIPLLDKLVGVFTGIRK